MLSSADCRPSRLHRLHHAVHTSERAVDHREIDVDARFYQARRHNPASPALAQTLPDLVQHALTMYRVHEGCQMVRAFPVEQLMQPPRLLAAVHDAKRLVAICQTCCKIVITEHAVETIRDAFKLFEQFRRRRCDLAHGEPLSSKHPVEGRLRRRAQYHRTTVVRHELYKRAQTRKQLLGGNHLRLVKHDHAVRDIVQLAAARCPVSVERLEELYVRRHHDGRVPILGRSAKRFLRVA